MLQLARWREPDNTDGMVFIIRWRSPDWVFRSCEHEANANVSILIRRRIKTKRRKAAARAWYVVPDNGKAKVLYEPGKEVQVLYTGIPEALAAKKDETGWRPNDALRLVHCYKTAKPIKEVC